MRLFSLAVTPFAYFAVPGAARASEEERHDATPTAGHSVGAEGLFHGYFHRNAFRFRRLCSPLSWNTIDPCIVLSAHGILPLWM